MANNKVTIDVEARFIDNLTPDVKKADKAIDNLEKKKPKVVVDAETDEANRDLEKTSKKLDEIDKKHPKAKVGLNDEASRGLDKILDKTKALADKVTTVAVKIRDNDTLAELSKIDEKARGIAGKTWTAAIRVKDMAMAPLNRIRNSLFSLKTLAAGILTGVVAKKAVIDPTQYYANYEDTVTRFKVLLGSQEAADKRMEELTSFAGETPFKRDEIYQASRVLQTYTQGALATPDAAGGLRMVGDIAAATGAEYTQVATYMGRLYNEVKRGGESMGEPLAFLREMGALSAEQEEKIKKIATGSGSIEEKWKNIAGQFKNVDGMMLEMSDQTNNLLLGIKTLKTNFFDKPMGEGISSSLKPFLKDFRQWRKENGDLMQKWYNGVRDFAAKGADYVLTTVRKTASRAFKIMQSDEFQEADMFGKIGMLWEGAIKNPFKDWWDGTVAPWWDDTAVPWLTEKSKALGTTIGTGLSGALLTLFGADTIDAGEQGASIAGSFVQGFLDGFDGGAVAEAIVDAIGQVWGMLPTWAQVLLGSYGVARGAGAIANLAGGVASFAGGVSTFLGGASTGTGLLGAGANTAIALGAGNLAGGASLSAGALSTLGLGSIAGGVVGAGVGASGAYDLYKGVKNNDQTKQATGAIKIGGVAAGALGGAALGAKLGMIGGPAGALIGAGIGGVGGLLFSGMIERQAAESAKSIKELTEQQDSNSKAATVMAEKQTALANSLGDVRLSYAEISEIANNVITGDAAKKLEEYTVAAGSARKAIVNLQSSEQTLKKLNWKASVGFKFNKEDKETYKKSIEDYIENAESVIESQHYQLTAAVNVFLDPKSKEGKAELSMIDEVFAGIQKELDSSEKTLNLKVDDALKDGIIDFNEQEQIEKAQGKIADLMNKINNAMAEAEFEAIKIKFSASAIDDESFQQLQEEISAKLESTEGTATEAMTYRLAALKLKYPEGGEAYEEARAKIESDFNTYMEDKRIEARDLQFDILGDSFAEQLGVQAEKVPGMLKTALDQSLAEGIAPMSWTAEQAAKFLGVETLEPELATGIGMALQTVAENTQMDLSAIGIAGTDTLTSNVQSETAAAVTSGLSGKFKGTANIEITPAFSGLGDLGQKIGAAVAASAPNLKVSGKKGGFRGGIFGMDIPQYGNGGQVQGGAQLITVAEEGSPEMIIPLSSQRRKRGLSLWSKAGQMMGVPGFAEGGIVGGNKDEGIRNRQGSGAGAGTQNTQVNVGGVTVEVNVSGNEGQDIVQAIASHGQEIAEQISGILAEAMSAQFANTPTRG